ncbi:jg17892 [Pararge aegeria aegeria]|uniref:Jg17892 protein n=1 Tax=Pararge aegeria aegeria TaxID=348720 RepID=A0A8S4SK94_9NEOP|nr:jg17892 [Pararge aegeria aegeria]
MYVLINSNITRFNGEEKHREETCMPESCWMLRDCIIFSKISFGLGFLIFPDSPALRLGMFFSGVSPAGGASNIWTFILGGNLDLSLAMTSISTLAAFGLMPAWLFSLGQVVFANANIVVPYLRIGMFVIGLFIPLAIGLAMQRFTPRISAFMVRILKGFSTLLLLFIITFAIVTNLYIFELMTWQILVAGMGVPWLGYLAGYSVARLFRQPHRDALAISIESGIQNTGIAIFLLRYALPQPEADITTVKKEAAERDRERAIPARRRQRPRAGANRTHSPAQYSQTKGHQGRERSDGD